MRFRVRHGWLSFFADGITEQRKLLRLHNELNADLMESQLDYIGGRLDIKLAPGPLAQLRDDLKRVRVI